VDWLERNLENYYTKMNGTSSNYSTPLVVIDEKEYEHKQKSFFPNPVDVVQIFGAIVCMILIYRGKAQTILPTINST